MKIKNSKKLALAKETLKTLSINHLALVQGAGVAPVDPVDTDYCVAPMDAGTSSNSL